MNNLLPHLLMNYNQLSLTFQQAKEASRALMLLSDDEAQAISYQGDMELVDGKENPYTMVLQTANKWQTKIYENEEVVKQYNFSSSVAKD